MKKLMLGFAALAAATSFASIESSNIVGYQDVSVPVGYSIFTATFKNVDATAIDLNKLVPRTPSGDALTGDNKVKIYLLDTDGNYGDTIAWMGTQGGWSKDSGASIIADGVVTIDNGMGFALNNGLKVDAAGKESTARTAKASPAAFQVSGQVDLVCANVIPVGYSVNGNSTPVAVDLSKIAPQTPNGVTLTGDNKVKLYLLDTDGNYGDTIAWMGTQGGWSKDSGASIIAAEEIVLAPGVGFAINNGLKVDAAGIESTARTAKASPAVIKLPSPIK